MARPNATAEHPSSSAGASSKQHWPGGAGATEIVFVALEIGFRAPKIDFGVLETNFRALRAALLPITTPKKSPGKDDFRVTGIAFGAREMILGLQGSYVGLQGSQLEPGK